MEFYVLIIGFIIYLGLGFYTLKKQWKRGCKEWRSWLTN
jgi:hypothetical protein